MISGGLLIFTVSAMTIKIRMTRPNAKTEMISAEMVEVLFCAAKAACASGLNCACMLIEMLGVLDLER